ncbi:MAG: hypothetical protein LBI54_04690 [Lachnospiraceae bacterium]|nr:hypothetical protein [Lachnospiraceae bacterium]
MMKKICLAMLVAMFCSGCGTSEELDAASSQPRQDAFADNVTGGTNTPTPNSDTQDNGTQISENSPIFHAMPANRESEDISFSSDVFFASPFVSDGADIYMRLDRYANRSEAGLYVMAVGSDNFERVELDIPAEADIGNIATDIYGTVYLVITDRSNESHIIWCLDEDRQVAETLDISEYASERRMPSEFAIDKDGTFYLYWAQNEELLAIDREGRLVHRFTAESLGAEYLQSIGVGRDGCLYISYVNATDSSVNIGRLDVENGSIAKVYPDASFSNEENIVGIFRGTDTNLLLYSTNNGALAYDTESGVVEYRVPISEIGFSAGVDFYRSFLPDGRLLVYTYDYEQSYLKYVPVGR